MELSSLREWADARFRGRVGEGYRDFAITLRGMSYLIDRIQERNPKFVLDLGAGFSTLAFRTYLKGVEWTTGEHDESWLKFVVELLRQRKLPMDRCYTMLSLKQMTIGSEMLPKQDAILIDHGPAMSTRVNDIPWAISLLNEGGVLFFDDFRPSTNYQKIVVEKLRHHGFKCIVENDSRSSSKRAIGMAWRE